MVLRDEHSESLKAEAASLHIKLFLIPPRAHHFAGSWESAIKCAKWYFSEKLWETNFSRLKKYVLFILQLKRLWIK